MLKMVSGVTAKIIGPYRFMWVAMAVVAIALSVAIWMSYATDFLTVWLALNGFAILIIMAAIGIIEFDAGDRGDGFDWGHAGRPPVLWSVMSEMCNRSKPSWFRLIMWMSLIPVEVLFTIVLRPLVLVVLALLKPMPGRWD